MACDRVANQADVSIVLSLIGELTLEDGDTRARPVAARPPRMPVGDPPPPWSTVRRQVNFRLGDDEHARLLEAARLFGMRPNVLARVLTVRGVDRALIEARIRSMSAATPARQAAYAVIRRVFEEGAYADRALHGEAKDLDPRERWLAMQLAYGTVQRRLTLDHVIERLARPVGELDAQTLAALRLGLYQLMFLDGVAAHAVVGESVELAKGGRSGGHKLVNAVLRRAARGELPALPADDTPAGASVAHSYPRWIVDMWWSRFGPDETRALLRAGNEPGELALRVNTLRAQPDDVVAALGVPRTPRGGRAAGGDRRRGRVRCPCAPASGARARTRRSHAARCSSPGRSIRSRASACSTSVQRRAARRRTSPR